MRVIPLPVLSEDGYSILSESDITCGIVPDGWIFVDGRLNKWDNFIKELNEGDLSFKSIKVGLRRFADLTQLISYYEQSNTKSSDEEESDLRTEKYTEF